VTGSTLHALDAGPVLAEFGERAVDGFGRIVVDGVADVGKDVFDAGEAAVVGAAVAGGERGNRVGLLAEAVGGVAVGRGGSVVEQFACGGEVVAGHSRWFSARRKIGAWRARQIVLSSIHFWNLLSVTNGELVPVGYMGDAASTIRVLHVDDEREFVDLAATLLERQADHIEVETATGPEDGLELLDAHDFDCVVSDYNMPKTNGIEFLEAVREDHPDLPFILFTGRGSEQVAADAISAGATDYIQKTSDTSQYTVLANRIENVTEQYRTSKRVERANRRHRRTLDRITGGYLELDGDLVVTDANEQAVDLTDRDRGELVGLDLAATLADAGASDLLAAYESVIEAGDPETVVTRSAITPDRWFEERIFPADDGDGAFVYFQDVTDQKEREQFREVIIAISSRLITADVDSIDDRIEAALEQMGEFADADRCYVFRFREDGALMDNTHEWCADGVPPQQPELQGLDTGAFSWYVPKVEAREIVRVPSLGSLPPEAAVLRETLESGDIESIVTIPLVRGDELLGFIGLDWLEQQDPWSQDTIDLLELCGNTVSNALTRKDRMGE
jgi:CheY-like chemotaxis protein